MTHSIKHDLKHARVTTTTPRLGEPDTKDIETKSYYEELNSVKQEIQQSIRTTKATFITDIMKCVAVISDGQSKRLQLEIEADDLGNPTRIVKTWITKKEYYGR